MDAIWMKTYNGKITSSFLLSHHQILAEWTTNIWLQLFTHKIWSNILLLHLITSCLKHLIIDFLVAKDKISFNDWWKNSFICWCKHPKTSTTRGRDMPLGIDRDEYCPSLELRLSSQFHDKKQPMKLNQLKWGQQWQHLPMCEHYWLITQYWFNNVKTIG
jgi:hypothetical protein